MGHPAKQYCMACSLVNLHNKNASNEALLVCEKSRPDCEREITSRDDFRLTRTSRRPRLVTSDIAHIADCAICYRCITHTLQTHHLHPVDTRYPA